MTGGRCIVKGMLLALAVLSAGAPGEPPVVLHGIPEVANMHLIKRVGDIFSGDLLDIEVCEEGRLRRVRGFGKGLR
jgi:hypothetical protein